MDGPGTTSKLIGHSIPFGIDELGIGCSAVAAKAVDPLSGASEIELDSFHRLFDCVSTPKQPSR